MQVDPASQTMPPVPHGAPAAASGWQVLPAMVRAHASPIAQAVTTNSVAEAPGETPQGIPWVAAGPGL